MQIDQTQYFKSVNPNTGLTDIFQNVNGIPTYINADQGKTLFAQGLNADLIATKPYPNLGGSNVGSNTSAPFSLDIPNLIDVSKLKDAFSQGITPADITTQLDTLKAREADVAKNLIPTETETALQKKLAGVIGGMETAASNLEARPGIDFFTLDRGRSELQRMNELTVANLQRQIGIEQATRGQTLDASKFLLDSAKTGFDTLLKGYDSIQNRAKTLFDVVNTLNDNARNTFDSILKNFAGLSFDQLDSATQQKLNALAANLGIPPGILRQGMQIQADKLKQDREAQLFDQDIKRQQLRIEQQKANQAGAGVGGGIDAAYLATQVLNRKIDLKGNSLSKEEKAIVLKYLSDNKIPVPKPLTPAQQNAQADATSALTAVDELQKQYESDPNILYKNALPGFLGRIAGASQFRTAVSEATDVKTRIRTGAALNNQEISFYAAQAPQVGDSQKDVQYKLQQLRGFYLGMSGLPVIVASPDGKQSFMFNDLYEPQQRLGLREAINNGWTVQY